MTGVQTCALPILSHLKRFPIDTIKIDRSFVADLLVDKDDGAIVAAVIALAGALNIGVVAEGVETEAQRARLLEMGCCSYQGFLFSRAVPIAEFMTMLNDSKSESEKSEDGIFTLSLPLPEPAAKKAKPTPITKPKKRSKKAKK